MKKNVFVALGLMSALTVSSANAEGMLKGVKVENKVEVGSSIGHTEIKPVGYGDLNYGVNIQDTITINDQHKAFVGVEGQRTLIDESTMGNETKAKNYGTYLGYGYEFPVNYSLTVTPHLGLGYQSYKLKDNGYGKNELNRGYAQIGVDSKYLIQDGWMLGANAKYQRDLNVKEKMDGGYLEDPKRGYRYEVELGVHKNFGSNGELSVLPYYGKYRNSGVNSQKNIRDTGVRVNYGF